MSKVVHLQASGKLSGFSWQFPGGAESSYMYVVKEIANDPRLSKARKQELIDAVTYLVGHVISDADFQIRNDYGSASSSGIRWMRWDSFLSKPSRFLQWLLRGTFRELRMQIHLNDLSCLYNISKRMKKMQELLNTRVLNGEN